MKLIINRVSDAIKPNKLAMGTHSNIESFININKKGIKIPPPPSPPALERKPIRKRIRIPTISRMLGGNISSFFENTAPSKIGITSASASYKNLPST